jgi:hypothetical protein
MRPEHELQEDIHIHERVKISRSIKHRLGTNQTNMWGRSAEVQLLVGDHVENQA